MLIFASALVLMMVFRPHGIISAVRRTYKFRESSEKEASS
jgi:ABC-type branched-subunit amino acid transport system permease subunit